ncbi:MAG: NYN domain-containing protein [Candidatus Aminicenantes bacterium]|nr:NYN domain-containing protein [Candidatus Aminicenantes bacterium]
MTFHLIIDGYNLIRQSPELRRHDRQDLEKGRVVLLRKLAAYKRLKRHGMIVVFDGWQEGHLGEERDRVGGIEVVFSRRGEKADEVIKRLAARHKDKAVVVTSDRDLGFSCAREGCEVIASPEFEARLDLAQYTELKGPADGSESDERSRKSTKKKGPSRKLPKSQRRHRTVLKKL